MSFSPSFKGERDFLQYSTEYKKIRKLVDSENIEEGFNYISLLQLECGSSISSHDRHVLDVLTCYLLNRSNKVTENLQLISTMEGTINDQLMLIDFTIARSDTFWKAGHPLDGLKSLVNIEEYVTNFKNELVEIDNLYVSDIIEREIDIKNTKGIIHWYLGDVQQAHTAFQQAFSMVDQLSNKYFLATTLNNLGNINLYKGELSIALDFHKQALEIRKQFDNKTDIACSYGNIAEIYQYMGKYDLALGFYKQAQYLFETLDSIIYLPQLYYDLINIYLINNNLIESQSNLDKLKRLDNRAGDNLIVHTYFLLADGLILKNSSSLMSKFKSAENFSQIANGPVVDSSLTAQAIFNLNDVILLEAKISQNEDKLNDVHKWLDKLFSLAKEQNSSVLMVQCYLLDSKLKLVEFKIDEAKNILTLAQDLASSKGLKKFLDLITNELDQLLTHEKTWVDLRVKGASIYDRIDLAGLEKTLDNLIRKRQDRSELIDLIKQTIDPSVKNFDPSGEKNHNILEDFYKMISNDTYLTIYRQFKLGPEIYLTDELRFSKTDKKLLEIKLGVFFMTAVGQGENTNQGLFGPLPFPDNSDYESIVYACFIFDTENSDPRNKGKSYSLFVLTFPKVFEPYYANRHFITNVFEKFVDRLGTIQDIKQTDLDELKLRLIK